MLISTLLFILTIFLGLAALTVGMIYLFLCVFAQASGLNRLVEHYAAKHPPEGKMLTWQTVQVGAVRYRFCVTVGISKEELYLWVRPILSGLFEKIRPWLL